MGIRQRGELYATCLPCLAKEGSRVLFQGQHRECRRKKPPLGRLLYLFYSFEEKEKRRAQGRTRKKKDLRKGWRLIWMLVVVRARDKQPPFPVTRFPRRPVHHPHPAHSTRGPAFFNTKYFNTGTLPTIYYALGSGQPIYITVHKHPYPGPIHQTSYLDPSRL